MKLSELWLREWVNLSIDSVSLAEKITMAGLKVENIKPVAGYFKGVVIGHILECVSHPNFDKLWITKVDIGLEKQLHIVCGASNCRANLRVAVATVGALLPEGLKIKIAKLRGEYSEGMLCSFSELGITGEHDGIIELPNDAPVGQDIRDYLQFDDNTIDISITPNRADCFGLLGIARDIAACNRVSFLQPIIKVVDPVISDVLPVRIDATDACPRYFCRVIKGLNVRASTPFWIKERLRRCCLKSVNAIVDITNYVLLELGQPFHIFDRDQIEDSIIVRHAQHDDLLTLLNGKNVKLFPDTLVVADNKKVLAIAGIFCNSTSSVSIATRNIVLECAFFQPSAIASCARRYKLHTDSSYRYERGVDPELQLYAMERATALIVSIYGGKPGPIVNVTADDVLLKKRFHIVLRRKTLNNLLGYVVPDKDVKDIFTRLGFQVKCNKVGWKVLSPSWRFDITIEEDLIEEVARVHGYNNIPNVPAKVDLVTSFHDESVLPLSRVKTLLIDRDYQEAITYSFVDPKNQELFYPQSSPLVLLSPISQDMSVMRLSLLPGLLSAVVYNQNRQQQRIRLFESGLCFIPDNTANLGIRQDFMLSGVITGSRFDEHWDQVCSPVDFYDIKGDIEAILDMTGKLSDIKFRKQQYFALHPGQSAEICLKDTVIGFVGVIHPQLEFQLNLSSRTLVFELLWDSIARRKIPKVSKISRFPINRRDIAIVVDNNVSAADVLAECNRVIKNQLVNVNLFDMYQGRGVAKGFKSLAISLILQDTSRTLEEKQIAVIVARCVAALKQRFNAFLRD